MPGPEEPPHPLGAAWRWFEIGQLRDRLKREARRAALAGQFGEAHRLTAEAETVGKLYHPLFGGLLGLTVIIGAVAGAITIGMTQVREATVAVVVRGKTRSVSTYLASSGKPVDLKLAGAGVHLSPVSSGQSQNFPQLGSTPTTGDPQSGTLRLGVSSPSASRTRPSLLVPLSPGAKLGVSTDLDELSVAISGGRIRGSIDVPMGARVDWDLRELSGDERSQFEERNADVVEFEAQVRPALPFVVNVRDPDTWEISAEVERELTFARVVGASNPTVEISSGLESATLQFLELEKTLSIPKGDYLRLGMTEPGRVLLRRASGSESLEFEFEGEVSELRSGRLSRLHDRRPTLLETAAGHTSFKLLWSGLVFVWSLLWGIFKMKEG